jgi:hypothetical protein
VEPGVLVELVLSYRAMKGGWGDVVRLTEKIPMPLSDTVLVREQRHGSQLRGAVRRSRQDAGRLDQDQRPKQRNVQTTRPNL